MPSATVMQQGNGAARGDIPSVDRNIEVIENRLVMGGLAHLNRRYDSYD